MNIQELENIVEQVIIENPRIVGIQHIGAKQTKINYIAGQVMRRTENTVNLNITKHIIQEKLRL